MDIVINPAGIAKIRVKCLEWQWKITELVEKDAKRLVPVDTGKLRRNIYRVGNRVYVAGGEYVGGRRRGTFYWYFVEHGTRKMRAEPFMAPALYRKR